MWRWLHPLAQPETSYRLARRCQWWLGVPAVLLLLWGSLWGFGWAPADCKQGDGFRIIYLHVPAAFLSMGLYAAMAVMGGCCLIWQHRFSSYALAALGLVGAAFTFLALATGAIWGKPMWGAWWVWDARLTSELILFFLYSLLLLVLHWRELKSFHLLTAFPAAILIAYFFTGEKRYWWKELIGWGLLMGLVTTLYFV